MKKLREGGGGRCDWRTGARRSAMKNEEAVLLCCSAMKKLRRSGKEKARERCATARRAKAMSERSGVLRGCVQGVRTA
ncbi:hypothetical protein ACOSP7_016201 [Xanthoceras sorbifolium]